MALTLSFVQSQFCPLLCRRQTFGVWLFFDASSRPHFAKQAQEMHTTVHLLQKVAYEILYFVETVRSVPHKERSVHNCTYFLT